MTVSPHMRKRRALAGAVMALAALQAGGSMAADEVIARVGETELTVSDMEAYLATLSPRERKAVTADAAVMNRVVGLMLGRRAVLKELEAENWADRPDVKALLRQAREDALIESYLQSVSAPADDFPGDDAIQAAYEANKNAFLVPRQYRLAQIYIALPEGASKAEQAAAEDKLADVRKRLKAGDADFAAIARDYSDASQTAARGGDIGWVAESQIRPAIYEAAAGLGKGEVSAPLRLEDGWHIVKLIDTKAAYTRPLSEVRTQLAERLRAERAAALRRKYLANLLDEKKAAVNELALSPLLDE